MSNTLQLLNWYWWRNRFSIVVMISFVIIAQSMFWLTGNLFADSLESMVGMMLATSMMASAFSAINVFSAGKNLDLTSGKSAFPEWLFSLPISSLKLALVPIAGMIIAMAWAWLPFALTIHWSDPTMSILDLFVLPLLGMCGAASWLQALSWRPFRTGWHRMGVIVGGMLLVAALVSAGSVLPAWFRNVSFIVVAISGIFAAFSSVSKARYYGWRSKSGTTDSNCDEVTTGNSLSNYLRLNLPTSMSALLWRDWNRLGQIIPGLMLLISVPTILFVIFATPAAESILLIFVVPIFVISAVGTTLGKDAYFKGQHEWPQCLASLPVSNRSFLKSRLLNGLRVSTVMWLMAVVVFSVWLLKPGNLEQIQILAGNIEQQFPSAYQSGWPMLIGWMLFTFYLAIVGSLPALVLGLCGRKYLELFVVIVASFAGLVVIIAGSFYVTDLLGKLTTPELRSEYMAGLFSWVPTVLVSLVVIKLCLAAVSFWVSNRRVGFDWRQDRSNIVLGTISCLSLIGLFCLLIPTSFWPIHYTALIVVLIFPCGSLLLAIAALDWNRHR